MTNVPAYSANLTGKPLLFTETRITAQMRSEGMADDQILQRIWDHNLYQYNGRKELLDRARAILRRLDTLSPDLLDTVANGPLDLARLTVLYSIVKSNRLMAEFMYLVYLPNARMADGTIQRSDVDEFFRMLTEQDDAVSSWSESTIAKLKQVLVKTLAEVGLVVSPQDPRITRPLVTEAYRTALESAGDELFAQILTGGM